jgi:hypothetical protein
MGVVVRLIKIASLGDAGLGDVVDAVPSPLPSIQSVERSIASSVTVNRLSTDSFRGDPYKCFPAIGTKPLL